MGIRMYERFLEGPVLMVLGALWVIGAVIMASVIAALAILVGKMLPYIETAWQTVGGFLG